MERCVLGLQNATVDTETETGIVIYNVFILSLVKKKKNTMLSCVQLLAYRGASQAVRCSPRSITTISNAISLATVSRSEQVAKTRNTEVKDKTLHTILL